MWHTDRMTTEPMDPWDRALADLIAQEGAATPPAPAACEGRWIRQYIDLGEVDPEDVYVNRCSDCREWMVVVRYTGYNRPPDMTLEAAVRSAVDEHFTARRAR